MLFQTIELPRTSWKRWASSAIVHLLLLAVVVAIPWASFRPPEPKNEYVAHLYLPAPYIPPPQARVKPITINRIVVPPAPRPVRFQPPPKLQTPKQVVTVEPPPVLPRQEEAKLNLPQAPVPKIETAKIDPPRPKIDTRAAVKLGGFGDPNGVRPTAAPLSAALTVAKAGAFNLPAGDSHGAGSGAGNGGRHVALGGFGDGGSGTGAGSGLQGNGGGGAIRNAGFGDYRTPAPAAAPVSRPAGPLETPVEITFKPKPAYTAEAREKKIEGEVLLEVLFSADGGIHVLRVIRGLGHGLDEAARDAAGRIRFQPGTRGGSPVDMKGAVHIVFELS